MILLHLGYLSNQQIWSIGRSCNVNTFYIQQVPPEHTRPAEVIEISHEALQDFDCVTAVGSLFESSCDGAAYFSGYISTRLSRNHEKTQKKDLTTCQDCSNIFTSPDLTLHMFLSFKEYRDNVDSS